MKNQIRTRPSPNCYVCSEQGKPLYEGLKDRLFGAPGEWNFCRCPNPDCGLVWLDPSPLEEDISKAYQTYYTHDDAPPPRSLFLWRLYWAVCDGYLQHRLGYTQGVGQRWYRLLLPFACLHPGGLAVLDATVMFLNSPSPNARLLEIGCGNGRLLARMRNLGWEVEGLDVDAQAVEVARAKNITVRHGDLSAQGYPDNSFDAIYMGHLIEHVHDPLGLIRECCRVLKPGGTLVIVTPNTDSWGLRYFGEDWRGLDLPRHLHLFNSKNIQQVVKKAGNFSIKKSSPCIKGPALLFLTVMF